MQLVQYCLSDLITMAAEEPVTQIKPARGKKKADQGDGAAEGAAAAAGATEEEKAADKAREEASLGKLLAVKKPEFAEKALNAPKTLQRILSRARRYMDRLNERQRLLDLVDGAARTHEAGRDGGFSEFVRFDVPRVRGGDMTKYPLWERDDDRDLLRGSLRHGWITNVRQDTLQEFFDEIRCARLWWWCAALRGACWRLGRFLKNDWCGC